MAPIGRRLAQHAAGLRKLVCHCHSFCNCHDVLLTVMKHAWLLHSIKTICFARANCLRENKCVFKLFVANRDICINKGSQRRLSVDKSPIVLLFPFPKHTQCCFQKCLLYCLTPARSFISMYQIPRKKITFGFI